MLRVPTDSGRADDEQTNFVRFDTICLAVEHRSVPADCGGLMTDRRILFVLTQSVWPSSANQSEPEDCGRVDDSQTNSVSFDTICLAVERSLDLSRHSTIDDP
jgi:hypothetical protein